jgi:hypothetical protein
VIVALEMFLLLALVFTATGSPRCRRGRTAG